MTKPTATQPSLATDLTGAKRMGSDEFFYDIFGINIKGLKSIWTLIRRPAEYFEAARLPDWGGNHWPSIRIWLGLTGILIALQFLWASESSETTALFQAMAMSIAEGLQAGAAEDGQTINLDGLDRQALGKRAFKLWIFIYPFFFIAAMCALALIYRAWKPAVGFVVRLRYIFGIIVPGSVFGLVSALALVNVTGRLFQIISFAQLGVLLIIYGITAYRGPLYDLEKGERFGLACVSAILILTFITIAQFISMMISIVPAGMDIVETLKPQIDAAKAAKDAAP